MITFVILGETPAKKNSRIVNTKTGRSFPSKRYTQWHRDAMLQVYTQKQNAPIDKPCRIKLTFTHGDLRRRDSDNGSSSILDLLIDSGVLTDDNWQIVRVFQGFSRDQVLLWSFCYLPRPWTMILMV